MELFDEFVSGINNLVIDGDLEIEAKVAIDGRKKEKFPFKYHSKDETIKIAKNVIDTLGNDSDSVEESINLIRGDGGIKKIVFKENVQDKNHEHYKKEKIVNPILFLTDRDSDNPSYKLGVVFEKHIDSFETNECSIGRIKVRYSIIIKQWRVDITLVKTTETCNPQTLKTNRNMMITGLSVLDFKTKAPWYHADTIEFEIEYVGKPSEFTYDSIIELNNIANSLVASGKSSGAEYQKIIHEVAKILKPKMANKFRDRAGLQQLGNHPIELDRNIYIKDVMNRITDYYITDKLDGKRAIIYINGENAYFITDVLTKLHIRVSADPKKNNIYVFDCEEYNGKYYIFDVMVFNGKYIFDDKFEDRMKYFSEVDKLFTFIKIKPFIRLTDNYKEQIKEMKEGTKIYETDGIILTPYDGKYNDMTVYKYKPYDRMTIDFLIKKCPDILLGVKPYIPGNKTLYILFCGINSNVFQKLKMEFMRNYTYIFPNINVRNEKTLPRYFPIQFDPSSKEFAYLYWGESGLDNKAGEFRYIEDKWHLNKLREDRQIAIDEEKYFGNNYKTAESIWMNFSNPLTIEDAKDGIEINPYFKVQDNQLQKESRNFNNYVKSKVFETFRNKNISWVMDMASGKGQDLTRYSKGVCKNGVLFLEIDKDALMELISRKHEFSQNYSSSPMRIMIQQVDLNDSADANIAKIEHNLIIPPSKFDLVMCNLAFHYLVATNKAIDNIAKFIDHYVGANGRFMFSTFNAKRVVELMKEHKGEWKSKVPGKFGIKKLYVGDSLLPVGQKINVLLPFSSDKYYEESLVNIDLIGERLSKFGFTLETNVSFADFLPGYHNASSMDDDDKLYSGLYSYYCFYKKKTGGRRRN